MTERLASDPRGFWRDKELCWACRGCIAEACLSCVAYCDQSQPCWEHEDTLCKQMGINTCFSCEVFKRYGSKGRPPSRSGHPSP